MGLPGLSGARRLYEWFVCVCVEQVAFSKHCVLVVLDAKGCCDSGQALPNTVSRKCICDSRLPKKPSVVFLVAELSVV